jgi:hypothetical protein
MQARRPPVSVGTDSHNILHKETGRALTRRTQERYETNNGSAAERTQLQMICIININLSADNVGFKFEAANNTGQKNVALVCKQRVPFYKFIIV